jgi:epsin
MPSSHQLAVLAEYTYNERDCADCLQILDKRLLDRGKMWRHTYKSLIVVEHLLFKGSRSFVRYFR